MKNAKNTTGATPNRVRKNAFTEFLKKRYSKVIYVVYEPSSANFAFIAPIDA